LLPQQERLKYNGLFLQTYEQGSTLYSKNLKVTFTKSLERCQDSLPLVGFVVSKSYSKRAYIRNHIKRQLREVYRLFRMDLTNPRKLKSLGLVVISIKKNFQFTSFQNLKTELESLLNQAI